MSLQLPVLDDTDFEELLQMALEHIDRKLGVEWKAASEGDPGRMLIEVFAYLTDQMIYRMNRLPAKVYIAFLRLLGLSLHPPVAAEATLEFKPLPHEIPEGASQEIEIPRGTRVTTVGGTRGEGPVFVTLEPLRFPLGPVDAEGPRPQVKARHCTWVEQEELGTGSGQPGLSVQVGHAPIVAPFHPAFDVRVWVEVDPTLGDRRPTDETLDGIRYHRWQEVPHFGGRDALSQVYVVDRLSGTVRFAPAARLEVALSGGQAALKEEPRPLAVVPEKERRILVSYAHGGGAAGNVLPDTLTAVLDPIRLISRGADGRTTNTPQTASYFAEVTNPRRADGGRDSETLDNALLRGPLALYTQEQAVTARDYERIVRRESGGAVARARALTQRAQWTYAEPGTVEITMVPAVPQAATSREDETAPASAASSSTAAGGETAPALQAASLTDLERWAQDVDLTAVKSALEQRAAAGTGCTLKWARYKDVRVTTTIGVSEEVGAPSVVQHAVGQRLRQFINPFNDPDTPALTVRDAGWPFGRPLTLDEIEGLIEDTPGVARIQELELHFAAPNAGVRCLIPDPHQPRTWYAGSHGWLYRSLNDGRGWERMREYPGETIRGIRPDPDHDGLLALVTQVNDPASPARARIYVSADCGQTWTKVTDFNYPIEDAGWLLRANLTILLLATDQGLYEFELHHRRGETPWLDVPSLVPVAHSIKAPLYALTVIKGQRGQARVAVALKSREGVYISDGADLIPGEGPALSDAEVEALTQPAQGLAQRRSDRALQQPDEPLAALSVSRANTYFRRVPGLDGQDVRHLAVERDGLHSYLWAGVMAEGNEAQGCYRWPLGQAAGSWINDGWKGGSCRALAFDGSLVYAATQWGGVLKLDLRRGADVAQWTPSTQSDTEYEPSIPRSFQRSAGDQRPDYSQEREYEPLWAIAVSPSGTLMVGGEQGILRRVPSEQLAVDTGRQPEELGDLYEESSASKVNNRTFRDGITLPYDGLFVSGDHEVRLSGGETGE